ncbi:kinesin-like protein KIN-10C isoform X2 [Olea europaea var. sylvestris]|uniref:kinesin-like protein KIN-10C isoform X2 n=1 Tax=Olea europaea var. sylvestris TaxID=158386 RepID=UPI000C1D0BD0|nr:kinesin-like protein KIN-10C isoform X2 [Olea europaea var. sylvestris]
MASVMADPDPVKVSKGSIPSTKVRIIGKIKGFTDQESQSLNQDSKKWITVKKSQENDSSSKVMVSFESQSTSRKDPYELDYCYEQDEDIDLIYLREIRPMVLEVLDGGNASVIALGARGSGKTCTIQGSQGKPGLAVMAMSEILSKAMKFGKSVSVSLYEVIQEHAYDLLDPKHPEVQILEGAQGKIHFKGLSQVDVKSIQEFHNIYFSRGSFQKSVQKIPTEKTRCHKGLMIHVSSEDDNLKAKLTSKMNFIDLADYEDPRRNIKDGTIFTESSRTNKSLYTLLNVVYALNANEKRVPYRESKLTRILQDSLGGTSHAMMLMCLNPSFCQDTVCAISLVSLSRRNTKQVSIDSTNRSRSSAKVKMPLSIKSGKTPSTSLTMKKQIASSMLSSTKENSSILRGRKLFDEEKSNNSKQLRSPPEDILARKSKLLQVVDSEVTAFSLTQDKSIPDVNLAVEPMEIDTPLPISPNDMTIVLAEKDVSPNSRNDNLDVSPGRLREENVPLKKNEDGAPSLTERLREISNNLRSLSSSTPSRVKFLENVVTPCSNHIDPKTPVMQRAVEIYHSPRGTFSNRSSGVKHSLVQEYLTFLNSANKEELKGLKGIGEKRANYILERREETPEPFKQLDDLQDIGLSAKQIKGMMKQVAGELFN